MVVEKCGCRAGGYAALMTRGLPEFLSVTFTFNLQVQGIHNLHVGLNICEWCTGPLQANYVIVEPGRVQGWWPVSSRATSVMQG